MDQLAQTAQQAQRRFDLRPDVRLDRDVPVETILLQRRERAGPVDQAVDHPLALACQRVETAVLEVHVANPGPRQLEATREHVVLAADEGVARIPVDPQRGVIRAPARVRRAARQLRDFDVQRQPGRGDFVGGVAQHLDHLLRGVLPFAVVHPRETEADDAARAEPLRSLDRVWQQARNVVLAQRLVFLLALEALHVATPTEEHLAWGSAGRHRLEQAWRNGGHRQAEFLE